MERERLGEEQIKQLVKDEHIKNFYYTLQDYPEQFRDWYKYILYEDFNNILVSSKKLIELLKTLVKDEQTTIYLLEDETIELQLALDSDPFVFTDIINLGKDNERKQDFAKLYVRNYIPENEREKPTITLLTNLFKVELDPLNTAHATFMKKLTDLRTNLFLKEFNETDDIKNMITLLKYTFKFSNQMLPTTLASSRMSMSARSSRIPPPASTTMRKSNNFYDFVEKTEDVKSFNFYKDIVAQFTKVITRTDEIGLVIYEDWFREYTHNEKGLFFHRDDMIYFDYKKFKKAFDDYVFDNVFDYLEDEDEEYFTYDEDEDTYTFIYPRFINSNRIKEIKKGKVTFLGTNFCIKLDLNNDDDDELRDKLYKAYFKDYYKNRSEIEEFKKNLDEIFYAGDPEGIYDNDEK